MFDLLLPAHVKKGKLLLQGVKKFAHQNRDLMTEAQLADLAKARDEYAAVLETRDKAKLEEEEKTPRGAKFVGRMVTDERHRDA